MAWASRAGPMAEAARQEASPGGCVHLAADRWKRLMGNLSRAIKGPYYFGEQPSCVDFFLLQAGPAVACGTSCGRRSPPVAAADFP